MPHDHVPDPDDPKPWLVIPYFTADLGRPAIDRSPLPSPAIWWLCPSIRVNGGPLRVYTPGETMDIDVDVRDYGGGADEHLFYVTAWWSDPTVGFSSAKHFGAAAPASILPKGGAATVTVTGQIPVGAPPHVCLLVSVEAAFNDNLPPVPAPGVDRHWAQLNIDEVKAAAGKFTTRFVVANAQNVPARVRVRTSLLAGERLSAAMELMEVQPSIPDQAELRMSVVTAEGEPPVEEHGSRVDVDLAPGGQVTIDLDGQLSPAPPSGSVSIVEILQCLPNDSDAVIGSLAIAVVSD